ncbi:Conserved_hypothetical protein [Hexamita inflata]|uniref:Uncharacterized protein n=1 Tax=Hexamita inflata TaxID=28002 RepID=A0AA86P3C9_9EUKA|nr:Conserved hypothetical protein [Hexamita inflata]CAI9971663.1 Conserved hypothetical protein [Hexamita inflata]
MTLTNIQFCFDDAQDDIVCMVQNPVKSHLVAAGSQDNCLYIFDIQQNTTLAKITDFQDSVTHIKWTSATQFLACSLDGSLRLYQFDGEYPVPILVKQSLNQTALCFFKIYKNFVFAQSEDSQFYIVDFAPVEPQMITCVYVESLVSFEIFKSFILLVGKQIIQYNFKTNEQKQILMQFSSINESLPTCSYLDKETESILIGFADGVTEVYQIHPGRFVKLEALISLTIAGVNCINQHVINQNVYFYIGTNDALYVYEKNFVLRNCFKLVNQGVSCFKIKQGAIENKMVVSKGKETTAISQEGQFIQVIQNEHQQQFSNVQLICGLTDGEIAVFDALSIEKICTFDGLHPEGDDDKPVLALIDTEFGLLVTGDRYLYCYANNFEEMGLAQKKMENEESLQEDVDQQAEVE